MTDARKAKRGILLLLVYFGSFGVTYFTALIYQYLAR